MFCVRARKDKLVKLKRVVTGLLRQMALFAVSLCLLMPSLGKNALALDEDRDESGEGRVYVLTNQAPANTVTVLHRAADGTLTRIQEVLTGGSGSGPGPRPPQFPPGPGPDPLNSADAITLTQDGRFLLAVNPRSNDVSVLAVTEEGLRLVDKAPTQGIFPVSVTTRHGLVYVVNQGQSPTNSVTGPASITGFFLDHKGRLTAIPHSTRTIGESGAAPGKVSITPDGDLLVVAETIASFIDVFRLQEDGRTGALTRFPSNNRTPLAIAFTHHRIMAITEGNMLSAQTGTPNGSSTSTYRITDDETLEPISKAVPNFQTSNCWVRFTPDGRYAYTGNTGSGSVSSYSVSPRGELTLLAAVAGNTGGFASVPIDLDITRDGKFLYVIASFIGTVQGFRIEEDGSLTHVSSIEGFPVSAQGIVAR
jgi:6-phosphogluconolactonase (cycloisomerase 2 family)